MNDANTIEALHSRMNKQYSELKKEGLIVDHWSEFDEEFKVHITKIRSILDNSVNVWIE